MDVDWPMVHRLEAAAQKMSSAADRMEEAARRIGMLLEDGYGGNGTRLIELLESAALAAEERCQPDYCDCPGFHDGSCDQREIERLKRIDRDRCKSYNRLLQRFAELETEKDAERLDAIENGQWIVQPALNGGWNIEGPVHIVDEFSEWDCLYSGEGTLRAAIDAARKQGERHKP